MLKKVLRPYLTGINFLILIGVITWSLVMFRSGLSYNYGLGFWGANGHDGIWHVSLAESLSRNSFNNPVFAGEKLKNYHLGFDLFLSYLHKITGINISLLYFQILPIVFSLLIGILTYKFVFNWRGSKSESLWATIFVFFGSSFGFIVTYLRDGIISGESMFWSSQSISTLVNPPFAMSLILILSGLIFLIKYQNTKNIKLLLLTAITFGILIQIKVYAGLLVLAGLFVLSIYKLFNDRDSRLVYLFLLTFLISLFVFLPFNKEASSSILWQPFWFLETLMSYSDRLGWERYYSAMTTYRMGNLFVKEILAYGFVFVIFVIGNMGLRIIGFDFIRRILFKNEKIDGLVIFILTICFSSLIIPTFFVQKGTPWNTIQFFYYFLFFFSIISGISISLILEKTKSITKGLVIMILMLFSILGAWATLQHYLPPKPQAMISTEELEALNFLQNEPQGVVFTYPFNKDKAKSAELNPPRPLYFYDSTAYVSAFTKKDVYLEDEVNLNIMGYQWIDRRQESIWFISNLDQEKGKKFLVKNNIKYLYLVKRASPIVGEYLKLGSSELGLSQIFENNEVIIFKTNKPTFQ